MLEPYGAILQVCGDKRSSVGPLKMDGWNLTLSYWVKRPIFRGKKLLVLGRAILCFFLVASVKL